MLKQNMFSLTPAPMAAKPMSNQTKDMEPTSHSSWKTAPLGEKL
jgi:hypothetical protein